MRSLWAAPLVALAAGCASLHAPSSARLEAPAFEVRDCALWFAALDRSVDEAGVRDAQYARIGGFPYLRVDRNLAALRGRAAQSAGSYAAYVERLRQLDLEARAHELRNLPRDRLEGPAGADADALREAWLQRTGDCGRVLGEFDAARPQARSALLERAVVPDDYSTIARFAGLYFLARIPFAAGVRGWEADTRLAFQRVPDERTAVVRYSPPAPAIPRPRGSIARLLARAELDPLGQVELSALELSDLAAAYAPSFEIPITGDYDRFGMLRWRRGVSLPEVDASKPAVYVHAAHTLYGETPLLQLIYTIWFPERPRAGAVDFLAGKLDGVVWRVTLAPDGEPLLYDSIHPCGCFHQFFPTPRARPRPAPDALEEWAFVPHSLPRIAEGERPVLRLASRTHYIEGVELARAGDSLTRYSFVPYGTLRSLPRASRDSRSVFGPDGLIAGTERLERWVFWPMGVASAGAMRQWGRHATAFIGRRHFDDADLVERRFELDLGGR
jgi:hypothetical protein